MQWRMSDLTGNNSKKIYIDAALHRRTNALGAHSGSKRPSGALRARAYTLRQSTHPLPLENAEAGRRRFGGCVRRNAKQGYGQEC